MLIEPATLHSHPCTFSVWCPCCDQWHTRLHSRTGKVISERMFAFELGACILCAPPAHSPDTSSKDFSRSLGAQGKFLRHAGKEDRRTPRNELIVLSVRLTFPKFNSHSQLGICAQPGSTKATRCTYKIGTSCAWFHTHTCTHTHAHWFWCSSSLLYGHTYLIFGAYVQSKHTVQITYWPTLDLRQMQHFPSLFINLPHAVRLSHRSITN